MSGFEINAITDDVGPYPKSAIQYAVVDSNGTVHTYGDQDWVADGRALAAHPGGRIERRRVEISYGAWEAVPPPTPPEPEPGAYLIGDKLAVRFPDDDSGAVWAIETNGPAGYQWMDWDPVWVHPDVTIVKLVPEPPTVELPWETSRGEFRIWGRTVYLFGQQCTLTKGQLEDAGRAFLSAARAAREADHG